MEGPHAALAYGEGMGMSKTTLNGQSGSSPEGWGAPSSPRRSRQPAPSRPRRRSVERPSGMSAATVEEVEHALIGTRASSDEIADAAGLDERTVRRVLAWLVEVGAARRRVDEDDGTTTWALVG